MTDKEKHATINSAWREQRNANRVNWVLSTSRDPEVQKQDRADLNAAIRRAAGRDVDDQDGREGSDHER